MKINEMRVEDKVALCSGEDFWNTKKYEEYGIPTFAVSDGPNGLRKQMDKEDNLGINKSYKATAFPTSSISACSFDEELLEEVGKTIANEAQAADVKVVLGPGCNIKRNPLCGRNFEYFSEDPCLSGRMAASFIKGVESTGDHACLKHFALNNQEYKRFSSDSIADEKTMREIYLKSFEIAIKQGKPGCVMSSYNKVLGTHSSENEFLIKNILREEWGFDGLVMTDWGGMSNRSRSFEVGCDLFMPGGSAFGETQAVRDIRNGKLDVSCVDKSVKRIVKIADEGTKKAEADLDKNYEVAKKVALDSIVLLKNEDSILPLNIDDCAYIGMMAKSMRYQGSGSSHINPYKLVNPLDCTEVRYCDGYKEDGTTSRQLLDEAKQLAKQVNKVVLFIGLTEVYESEGFDRENLRLPEGHIKLVEEISEVNPNIVVALMCGSVVELPFIDKIKGLVYMGLAGEAAGEAVNEILTGKTNPSGKLAETWAIKYEDYVNSKYYGTKDALYKEGIYVGYRYFDKADKKVQFPFGFGLSYSRFEYSDIEFKNNVLTCKVKNISDVSGKEIVQLYVGNPDGYRAKKELRDFKKIYLKANEEKTVSFNITDDMFKVFNEKWITVKGRYKLMIASSSRDIRLEKEIDIEGSEDKYDINEWYYTLNGDVSDEDFRSLYKKEYHIDNPVKGQFTMDNTVMEMKDYSLIMKIMYKVTERVIAKSNGGKVDYNNPEFKMMMNSSADCSLNGMKVFAKMDNQVFEGLLEMANGHFFRGLVTMCKKN